MRRKMPVLILALIILLQVFSPSVFATSKNETVTSTTSFCSLDTPPEGTGQTGKGFNSFNALKKELGSAGEGKAWHHIVEQNQIQKSGFSPQQIHNTNNVIAVDSATHAKISGLTVLIRVYRTLCEFVIGLRVRVLKRNINLVWMS